MTPLEVFDSRIAVLHMQACAGDADMDVRHQEFMAMAETYLGPQFNHAKLARTEALQVTLHEAQGVLAGVLQRGQIDRRQYFDELNALQVNIAKRCEAILGAENFIKLFGVSPAEVGATLDKETFLAQT